jgi:hypothetical protein
MISKSFAVIGALTLLSAAAYAESVPPKELYGKSITLQWSQSHTGKTLDDPIPRQWGRAISVNIYISTTGRPFMRQFETTTGGFNPHGITNNYGQVTREAAPNESNSAHFDFQGRSVLLYRQFKSGVRRIAIDVDGSGTSCKATVINGREGGKDILQPRAEISSTLVGSVSCSIREGNVFGH